MNKNQADEKIEEINNLVWEIFHDKELKALDERYSVMADWIDTNIDNVSL